MKKFLALIALVAMVAVSSVSYAQTAVTTVGGTLAAVSSIGSCSASIALDPNSVQTANCVAANYVSNAANGTDIDYATDGLTANLVSATNTDLAPVILVSAGSNQWSLQTVTSTVVGATASGSGTAPSIAGVQVLAVPAPTDGGSLTLTFAGSVGTTEASGGIYTNVGSLTITQY